jgi:hypothetical protein
MHLLVFVVFLLLSSFSLAEVGLFTTSFKDCGFPADLAKKNLASIMNVVEDYEESPFLLACKEPPGMLKGRPKTGLLKRSVIEKDSDGRTTRDFLKKVISKARLRVLDSFNQMANISKCMLIKTEECSELNEWIDKDLPDFLKAARYNLSLAQGPYQMKTWLTMASLDINKSLDPLGSYKFEEWAPLTTNETTRAEMDLSGYLKEINIEIKGWKKQKYTSLGAIDKFRRESLVGLRYKHYMVYHQMLAELPLLQYLKGPDVNRDDLAKAFEKMKTFLLAENNYLDEMTKKLESVGPLPIEVLELLNYNSVVEELLIEDSRDCKLASSLVFTMSNQQIGNSIALGLPILAVSFFAPPAIGLITGVVTGGWFVQKSYSEFSMLQQRSLGFIYGDSLGTELKHLDQSSKKLKYDIATLPVGMGVASLIGRTLFVSGRSFLTGNTIFRSYKK